MDLGEAGVALSLSKCGGRRGGDFEGEKNSDICIVRLDPLRVMGIGRFLLEGFMGKLILLLMECCPDQKYQEFYRTVTQMK